jgi:methionine synthase I (cobalamin-dependent)
LIAAGLDLRRDDSTRWNLTHPERVLELHRRDVAAGARGLVTNTFGANRAWLARFAQAQAIGRINRRAVALARQAVGAGGFVLGDIGPSAVQHADAAAEQAAILVSLGVDALLLETFQAPAVFDVLAEVNSAVGESVPKLASLWEWPDPPEAAAQRLWELGCAAIGTNCRVGMRDALALARRLHLAVPCPLLVKPGAATVPSADDDSTPAAFAAAVPELLRLRVRLLGGCCGTTSEHVHALAAACSAASEHAPPPFSPGAMP